MPNATLKTKKPIRLKKPTNATKPTKGRKTIIIRPQTLQKEVQSKPKSNNDSLDDDIEIINLDDVKVPTNVEDFI